MFTTSPKKLPKKREGVGKASSARVSTQRVLAAWPKATTTGFGQVATASQTSLGCPGPPGPSPPPRTRATRWYSSLAEILQDFGPTPQGPGGSPAFGPCGSAPGPLEGGLPRPLSTMAVSPTTRTMEGISPPCGGALEEGRGRPAWVWCTLWKAHLAGLGQVPLLLQSFHPKNHPRHISIHGKLRGYRKGCICAPPPTGHPKAPLSGWYRPPDSFLRSP